MEPVNELISRIENGTVGACELFAPDMVLDATVPGWRFSVRGAHRVRTQLADWFATPGTFEELRRTPLPEGELVEFLRTHDEPSGPITAHQVHILEVHDGQVTSDRVWCGGRWSAAERAEMAAAEDGSRAAI